MCIMQKIWHKYQEEIVWKNISNRRKKTVENFQRAKNKIEMVKKFNYFSVIFFYFFLLQIFCICLFRVPKSLVVS